ncbi:MAG: hypothetical protein A2X22_07585 [Bacteroidetes bacterium GWF2_49_14]|nr:MAG: hypothetical protein A2X22_07585 [Bacteroidetes bacterium GWF2_49_14]
MLSVLIPVYRWDPRQLVAEIREQILQAGIPYEIIVSDDTPHFEEPEYQQNLALLSGVRCFWRDHPLSRSANRNFLASEAAYNYLLFLDCDGKVNSPVFIRDYIKKMNPDSVLVGGTLYDSIPPVNRSLTLRWIFGTHREQIPASMRNRDPWKSFSTFNFLIPAAIFHSIRFSENLTGYGHEDTLFGLQLKNRGIPVIHLDNGLVHLGLDSAEVFLAKVRESVSGLFYLQQTGLIGPGEASEIKLLRTAASLRKYGLLKVVHLIYRALRKPLEKTLLGKHPRLYILDLYKLGLISQFG